MPSFSIRSPKDFWSGVMFLCFGVAAIYVGREYTMGSAGRMGAAYFPTVLGGLLVLIGAASIVRACLSKGQAIERFAFRELFLVVVSIVLFALLVRGAGLAVAIPVLILTSAWASREFTWKASAMLAVGAAVFSILLFVKALGVPMPVLGPWFVS